jgi:ribosomal protein S18 acetylase RimI-like enzyme
MIRPEYVCFVVNEASEVIGFGVSMPSLSEALIKCKGKLFPLGFLRIYKAIKKHHIIDMYLNGVRPDYQKKGIHVIYYTELMKAYIKNNIKIAITNPQLEENIKALLLWDDYEHRTHIKRRSFIKHFNTSI